LEAGSSPGGSNENNYIVPEVAVTTVDVGLQPISKVAVKRLKVFPPGKMTYGMNLNVPALVRS